jgi:DNA polymerase-3 subunit epsilon
MSLRKRLAAIYQNSQDYVILDTETTGLGNCEIIELSLINLMGNTLLDTRLNPKGVISDGATAIHGISKKHLIDCPSLPNIWAKFQEIVEGKTLLIYNSDFDLNAIASSLKAWKMKSRFSTKYDCVMMMYSEFVAEPGRYAGTHKWQKLPGGDHTALGDCHATLAVMEKMWRILAADNYVLKTKPVNPTFDYQYIPPVQQNLTFDAFSEMFPF